MIKPIFVLFLILAVSLAKAQNNIEAKAKQVVSQMTLEQKAELVVGLGMKLPGMPENSNAKKDKVPGAGGNTFAIPELGIPSMVLSDGPAGVRIDPFRNEDSSRPYYATAWPVATLLASTWDTSLAKRMGVAFGSEIHDYGIDIILAPAMNIQRNPLGGRNFEYYSEDPVVAGNMAAAIVNGIQSNGVGATIKHFVGNNEETNRMTLNTILSERALREIYLKGFEIAVKKSHPWAVMSSYNKINGTYTSEEYNLLTTILRKEWGFKGMVMSDWFGGTDPVAQMKAGNDLLMPGLPSQTKAILEAVKNGTLKESVLNENAQRILETVFKSPAYKNYKYSDKPDLKKDATVSRTVAEEGMVLLKNRINRLSREYLLINGVTLNHSF
ncbi:MAG TPA: glycoside hydrolase family 3 N-terminal domain-containing protein [Hanamia sp.]